MELPKDKTILLSVVNMKLRDRYDSLSALCEDSEVSEEEIKKALSEIGYTYNRERNRFE